MAKIVWDVSGERNYETGVDHGVLYPVSTQQGQEGTYPSGVAWNGLTTVTESPSGADATPLYADNIKYLNLIAAEQFGGTIEAYTYPDEFGECDGSVQPTPGLMLGQQARKAFGLAYRTIMGNDVDGQDHGYKLHLIYGALAAPSQKAYASINDKPDAIAFSWAITTTPVAVTGHRATAILTIDSTMVNSTKLATLEDILFGTAQVDPRLPLPDEVISILQEASPSALSLVSIAPVDDASGVAINANVVLTFNNAILHEAVVVAKDDGTIVPVARSWDTDHKVLTLNPVSDLDDGTTTYLVTVGGVVDVYDQSLTAVVKNFETVA
jgi:hypothetical protein